MKKFIGIIAAVIIAMAAVSPAQAQLNYGLKGGLNLSKVSTSKDYYKGDNRTGWFLGPMLEFKVPLVGIGFDIAALYSERELDGVEYEDAMLKSVEIPINIKWSYGLGSMLGVYVAFGPQFGFNVGHKESPYMDYQLKDNYTSFNVGCGVKLLQHLQIGVNYNFFVERTGYFVDDNSNYRMKDNTWQVSLALLF